MPNATDSNRPYHISAWQLIKPYWVSEEWKKAWALLLAMVVMNMAVVYLSYRLNVWNTSFYNVLANKDWHAFKDVMIEFSAIAFSMIAIATVRVTVRQTLEFGWRQWLTGRYLGQWLGKGTYYRIERDALVDNPDQRIADDLQSLATNTLSLSLDLLSNVVSLITFATVLWTLAGAISLSLGGHQLVVPGYMLWAAAAYALIGSWVMYKTNRPLVAINYQQQRTEADFRFGLIRVRENAEQIGFYTGEAAERRRLDGRFGKIRENWQRIITYSRRLTLVSSVYGQLAIIFPIAVAAPRYFAGAYTIGVLFRISDAFGSVSDSLSWFVNNYVSLADWRATVNRLREFHGIMHAPPANPTDLSAHPAGSIVRELVPHGQLTVHNLSLTQPDGTPLADIGSLHIAPGTRWLIEGPTGVGKSTLLRALAGLWQFGSGRIEIPDDARVMFLPQRSYLPIGTLRAALCYPSDGASIDHAALAAALVDVELDQYLARLDESAHWERTLSQGEQQKLAFARVLLQRPDYVFLDEATSALDPACERRLYGMLIARLPQAAIISVGHRIALREFHADRIDLAPSADNARPPQLATNR